MGTITIVDRLIFTLVFSVIIHLAIILGVSFDTTSLPKNNPLISLDITLEKQQSQLAPEQADYLAQVNNEGGGKTDEKSPEPSPEAPPPIADKAASSTPAEVSSLPEPVPKTVPVVVPPPIIAEIVETKPEPPKPVPKKPIPAKPKPPAKQVKKVTQKTAERKVEQVDIADIVEPAAAKPTLSASEIMFQARNEIDSLQAQLDKDASAFSKRPKKLRISASTKEYAAAAYLKSWEMKIERIGNMNYPQEAKRDGLNGNLMLSVDINPDGSVPPNGIVISRSSGYKVLDDAAVKIVRLGAPYAAIPENVLKNNDMLTIIRTWKFETNSGLSTR